MEKRKTKKRIKVDKIDCYIKRYRENIKQQDEMEKRRKCSLFSTLFKRS